jgi:hypothetical protein
MTEDQKVERRTARRNGRGAIVHIGIALKAQASADGWVAMESKYTARGDDGRDLAAIAAEHGRTQQRLAEHSTEMAYREAKRAAHAARLSLAEEVR